MFAVNTNAGVAKAPPDIQTEGIILYEGTTLAGNTPIFSLNYPSLGVLLGGEDIDTILLVDEIIKRESSGNPKAKNPSSTAYGYCQFINSTWEYVQKKWDMRLDRESPEDQLYACIRLLEEEGIIHWKASGPYNIEKS
jgi:hypothetical protein